jgi:hypothetical protein
MNNPTTTSANAATFIDLNLGTNKEAIVIPRNGELRLRLRLRLRLGLQHWRLTDTNEV